MSSDDKKDSALQSSIDSLKALLREDQDIPDDAFASRKSDEVLTTQSRPRDLSAVSLARRNLAQDPANPNLKDWLAFNLYANDEVDEAIELYEELIASGHQNSDQFYYLGNAYYKRGDYEQALDAWRRVSDLAPGTKRAQKAFDRIRKLKRQLLGLEKA